MKALLAAVALALSLNASAQYPSRPIKLIVPFAPGGPNDLIGRAVGQKMAEDLGQPVVLENRAGAGGTIGADSVAKAAADGYTLLLGTTGALAISPSLYPNVPYDPARSFTPISRVTRSVFLVVVNPAVPATSLQELIALAKARPGELAFGGINGTPVHVAGEMFKNITGIDLVYVPYKGMGSVIADLVAGRTQVLFEQLTALHPHVKAGKLRALAVAGNARLSQLPDVPTAAEAGVPAYEVAAWTGILAPAGTAEPIAQRLHRAIQEALATPAVRDGFFAIGTEAAGTSREEFAALIVSEGARWSRAVKLSGAKLD